MADWSTFAGFAGVVLVLLLLLARASQGIVSDGDAGVVDSPADDFDDSDDSTASIESDSELGAVASGEMSGPSSDTEPAERAATAEAADRTVKRDTTDAAERPRRLEDVEFPGRVQYGPAPERRPASSEDGGDDEGERIGHASGPPGDADESDEQTTLGDLSTGALLLNVALSQGLFAGLLLAGAWVAEIPASAFGVTAATTDLTALSVGVAFGVGLYVLNELAATVGERFDLGGGEALREALAPDSAGGWAVLLLVVLPIIAGFEELLFRGALVGVLSIGFGLSPWLLAVLSSVAFGLGHGAQGPVGILVTGAIGFVLAAAFVLTESLLVVVVAHYLVNALEFVVHEGFGWERSGWERTS
ncbi:CPBP family intramembrane glutamic endopeptidase [Haloprofundus halobius]|uniref:CPBP family intramembrane glutamic endopeptidase n=1 Tax=Haloprofundus halobius TaxID=2876194 RepID=UPI001CCB8319|nr:CPBP family intramembrane glutamic endopeptidase [Haloprofundus halobius]